MPGLPGFMREEMQRSRPRSWTLPALVCAALAVAASGTSSPPPLRLAGHLLPRASNSTNPAPMSRAFGIGAETMDRGYTSYSSWSSYAASLGVRRARLQAGWARTEQARGVYNFSWLDEAVFGLAAAGIEPWLQTSYGNPLYGPEAGDSSAASRLPRVWDSSQPLVAAAWASWVNATVHRYKNVTTTWELWNVRRISKKWCLCQSCILPDLLLDALQRHGKGNSPSPSHTHSFQPVFRSRHHPSSSPTRIHTRARAAAACFSFRTPTLPSPPVVSAAGT